MKVCTLAKFDAEGNVTKVLDVSLVDDDHVFGTNADGFVHIEGSIQAAGQDD